MKVIKGVGLVVGAVLVVLVGLYFSGYGGNLAMSAFVAFNAPAGNFDPANAVQAPDYADEKNWAALPGKNDPADLIPAGIEADNDGVLAVDTFFIHPTGFLGSSSWTSPMDADSATEENTLWMMANQASAYNGCCEVYAPRYREANIFAYFGDAFDRDAVLGFAYQDVRRAFEFYLKHYNQGRPFIIASHSQGTHHAKRLLQELIDTSDLHERMVAAYIIGSVLIPISPQWFESMSHISACKRADDLHCVIHWDTMPEGSDPIERPQESLCTNPLTWQVDENLAAAELNEGAVEPEGIYNLAIGSREDSATGQMFERLDAPVPGQTWAHCKDGSLFAADQQGTGFAAMGSGDLESYHGLDYALFYMNIRNNAILRAQRYLEMLRGTDAR